MASNPKASLTIILSSYPTWRKRTVKDVAVALPDPALGDSPSDEVLRNRKGYGRHKTVL